MDLSEQPVLETSSYAWTGVLHGVRSVARYATISFGAGTLLAVAPGPNRQVICVPRLGRPFTAHVDARPCVLASYDRLTARVNTDRSVWALNEHAFSSWLAFVDAALDVPSVFARRTEDVICEPVALEWLESELTFSHSLALDVLRGNADKRLIGYLRSSESYRLARYLLSEPADESQLRELGERYGVSYSHFRRLCYRAFNGAAKPRLRAWRAARAALQLIDGSDSVLQVAMSNGYASASHISNEVKKLLGVPPSAIRNAHALLP